MSLTLFSSPASPFVRKVRVLLLETGQDDVDLNEITTTPMASNADLMAAAPLAKLPTLVRDDGPALFDSRVICRYLNDRAGANLYPESRLWEVLTLEALADGIMDSAVNSVYEKRFRSEAMQSTDWLAAQWGKVTRALDVAEAQWLSHLSGPVHMGQIGMACALGYLDLRYADVDWRSARPGLAAWFATFSERPAMAATAPS